MGETSIHIAAPPDKVFAQLIKGLEDAEPGRMKVGDHFAVPGKSTAITVTLLERPTRFGLSWVDGEVTVTAEYILLPDAGGTQVRLEMEERNVNSPVIAWLISSLMLGRRQESKVLEELKGAVEKGPTK